MKIIRLLLILMLIALGPPVLLAQQAQIGNITTQGSDCSTATTCVTLLTNFSTGSSSISLTGTWSGTLQFEATADATPSNASNWVAVLAFPSNSTTGASSATANGLWTLNAANYTGVRVRCSTFSSGSIGALIRASPAAASKGGGGGAGGTVTSITAGTGLSGGTITGSGTVAILTAFQLPQSCSSTQIPQWNGSAWVCADVGASLPSGTLDQVLAATGTGTTYAAQTKPGIDIRGTSVSPAAGADFCAALNAAMILASANHSYVEAGNPGLFLTGAKVFCNSNPGAGITNPPFVHFSNYTIVTSVPWQTTDKPFQFYGDVPSTSSGTIIQACNAIAGTCGPSGYPIFPGTGANGRMFAAAGGHIPAPQSYQTGTITCAGTTCTGSGTTFVPQMVDGTLCSNNSGTAACAKAATYGTIASVTNATTLVLQQATVTASGAAYTIVLPNITAVVADGVLETTATDGSQASCFGHVWENITIDTNGVGGAVGYYTPNCQERSLLKGMKLIYQANNGGGTPTQNTTPLSLVLTSVNATGVYQGTITGGGSNAFIGFIFHVAGFTNAQNNGDFIATGSSATSLTLNATTTIETHAGTAAGGVVYACALYDRSFQYGGNSGVTHFGIEGNPQCGPGDAQTTTTSDGYIFEMNRQAYTAGTLGGIANDQTDGNNGPMDLGTITGKNGNLLNACVFVDGTRSMQMNRIHTEWCTTGVEVGLNNPSTVQIEGINGANTNTKLVWLHTNSLSSVVRMASAGGVSSPNLIQDDATGGITITGGPSCNTAFSNACLVPYYQQANGGASYTGALTASAAINTASDGTHNGLFGLFGNTTNATLPTGSFSFLGPTSLVTTPWGITWPAAENGSAGILHLGAASSHYSAATISAIATGDITSLQEDKLTGSTAATTVTETGATFAMTYAGVATANLTAPRVFLNTNSSNNNTSIGLGISTPGTSTGQTTLNVNGASTGGDLADFGTGGTWTAGVLSGQTIVGSVLINGAYQAKGTTAGFLALAQGSTSSGVAPCNVANTHCIQAGTAVTASVETDAPAQAQGIPTRTGVAATIQDGYSGDANHSATVTIGSGTSIGSTSLCSTAICLVGTYRVNVYVDITTACATSGTYVVNLIYTDDQGSKTVPVNLTGTGSVPATGVLTTTSTANFGYDSFILRSTGAASINYSTTAVACGTAGPMVGKLYMSVEPVQ
jgi:hypothetical protein